MHQRDDTPDHRLRALLDDQLGVASLGQAHACGLTRAVVRHRLATDRLERVGTRCVRLLGAPDVVR